ncbi:mycofactocin system transcriptional regulator [Rhodococcus sp. NPDC003382]|uniref:mycofactocin system transcriptional regulator n=1 Tax=unclassified Rhodococcus (in: high G+C Gram-positive bacteria) TaxID=192944 RepID=UPI0018CE7FE1|nr:MULTISPECIES: mycofactocin system transcriptional regulator [unclassified Rhodococcus (in: high G+C Gram-positive bacteria)]MBH0123390.1 mycofactocin system transcriptional regulator [Rhodococcus sp. CX]MCK8674347.1 mycofactocin system transcriptional regulator [Rhodococcus sp. HM1]
MRSRRKPSARTGRRPSTTREGLSAVGIELFRERGFDETSVDEIAEAAGIARRTFFRYFPSKNAVPWGDFDEHLAHMRAHLSALPEDMPLAEALASALLDFNTFPESEAQRHRARMELILRNPTLQAYSSVMYQGWRRVIAEFVAARTGASADDHFPRTVAYLMLAVAVSAYEQWLADDSAELPDLLASGMRTLYSGLNSPAVPPNEAQS